MSEFDGAAEADIWSRWLLEVRYGGSPAQQVHVDNRAAQICDRLLRGSGLASHETLLDVGTGDGLVALEAIARLGPGLRVLLCDISAPLLEVARGRALERGVLAQCEFRLGSAEKLTEIADRSVDVVASRAVLAYVADKRAAFQEMQRVLREGGRISLAEPIFRDQAIEAWALGNYLKSSSSSPPPSAEGSPPRSFQQLLFLWKSAQFPATEADIAQSSLANFSERDLVRLARESGFSDIHLELHVDVRPSLVSDWEVFLDSSPHPLAPPLREIMNQKFTQAERELFEQALRPSIESRLSTDTDTIAYMTAKKSR